MSQEEAAIIDPLHIGNLVNIRSEAGGDTLGRVIYRSAELVRILTQAASDRAVEFVMFDGGTMFSPELGKVDITIIEERTSNYYVDVLGARPGDTLEFFTVDGQEAGPSGVVEEIIKSASKDSIKLTDGRTLRFRGVGPSLPIAVVRVVSDLGTEAAAAAEGDVEAEAEAENADAEDDILALLNSVLPTATVEIVPTAEMSYPESMQREDLFQDLLAGVSAKQRTNPRRIRAIEREVDLAISLKNKSVKRDEGGRIVGPAPHVINTVNDAIVISANAPLPAAIPIVAAARVLNLDNGDPTKRHKATDVIPRSIGFVEQESEDLATRYLDGALPESMGRGFYAYMQDLLRRDQGTLQGLTPIEWHNDQDVIRTAGLGKSVQGLSAGLPTTLAKPGAAAPPLVTLDYLLSDVTDRSIRVLGPEKRTHTRSGHVYVSAPSDPSTVIGYTMLPPKAALALRPPSRPGHLPTALIYSAALESDNLPTIAQTLRDLYSPMTDSPQNVWTLDSGVADETEVAPWLESVLKYAIHPINSLGPRTPQLLGLLDTLGLGLVDMSPAVVDVIDSWNATAQNLWRSLLVERRKAIQAVVDAASEETRTFQSVTDTGDTPAPLWAALRSADSLTELLQDIGRRNPSIADAPTLMTASLLGEAQGDAAPLVWYEIMRLDARLPAAGEPKLSLDPVTSAAALASSRAYLLKRKALQDRALIGLSAAPEINKCPHVVRLEAVRNVSDVLQRSRLLRSFIEEFQGPKSGEWMTCVLCKANCVCYHEIMELEALAQPARMDSIQKQMLIKFGGDRYEGKIVCRNCGQGLQDIDYDEHVEFDDQGRPITSSSVLTDEQMEEPTETAWKKATENLAPPPVVFATQSQRDIAEALQTLNERGGLQMHADTIRQIVRYADLYVSLRIPPPAVYEKLRARMMTSASAKISTATGVEGAKPTMTTYAGAIDQLRISALIALTAIALQSADPPVVVNNPEAICKFSRGGFPIEPRAIQATVKDAGAIQYMACAIALIDRPSAPWVSAQWSGIPDHSARFALAFKAGMTAVQIIVGSDPKTAPLPFTSEINMALTTARTDVEGIKKRAMMSLTDQLPVGFRPDPHPQKMSRPTIERDPVAAIMASASVSPSVELSVSEALRQQGIAIVGELNEIATKAIEAAIATGTKVSEESVCCPVAFANAATLQGNPEAAQLLNARALLRGMNPVAVNAGTHLWPTFEIPVSAAIVEDTIDPGVYFKLFLKYCYIGANLGNSHEFSVGNICRQCGLRLGKPIDLIDFGKEGAAILAAQKDTLAKEMTPSAFLELLDAVRRQKTMMMAPPLQQTSWFTGLQALAAAIRNPTFSAALGTSLQEVSGSLNDVVSEVDRSVIWSVLAAYTDELRRTVENSIGPLITPVGQLDKGRAREAVTAMTMFDTMVEDPFMEGPRALQEYWCAKVQAAGSAFTVVNVKGAAWESLSKKHTDLINTMISANALWYGGDVSEGMRPILSQVAATIGPLLKIWLKYVRPGKSDGVWTVDEARMLLQTIVLQSWRDAITPTSSMYSSTSLEGEKEATAAGIANWTRALMFHVKQQFVKFSKETIKRVLQDRAGLERDTIVEEFNSIKDDDQRAAELLKKQFRIGRWAGGKNLQKYDADTFEFENEQRKRMGIVDPPVDPIMVEGVAAAPVQDFGLGAALAIAEDGYDADQGADGDDY